MCIPKLGNQSYSLGIAMSAVSAQTVFVIKRKKSVETIRLDQMYWGYIIRGAGAHRIFHTSSNISVACLVAGLVLAFVLAWPGVVFQMHAADFDFRLLVLLVLSSGVIWAVSHRPDFEFHINLENRTLCEVARSHNGIARVLRIFPFEQVSNAFIERSSSKKSAAKLILCLTDTDKPLVVAVGKEEILHPMLKRFERDILPNIHKVDAIPKQCRSSQSDLLRLAAPLRTVSTRRSRGFIFVKAHGVIPA